MFQRNLLCTALASIRQLVIPVGEPKAIAVAVRNDEGRRRETALPTRLASSVCRQEATPF
jgi:exodeoxyribonuclease V alpha subunit